MEWPSRKRWLGHGCRQHHRAATPEIEPIACRRHAAGRGFKLAPNVLNPTVVCTFDGVPGARLISRCITRIRYASPGERAGNSARALPPTTATSVWPTKIGESSGASPVRGIRSTRSAALLRPFSPFNVKVTGKADGCCP